MPLQFEAGLANGASEYPVPNDTNLELRYPIVKSLCATTSVFGEFGGRAFYPGTGYEIAPFSCPDRKTPKGIGSSVSLRGHISSCQTGQTDPASISDPDLKAAPSASVQDETLSPEPDQDPGPCPRSQEDSPGPRSCS